MSMIELLIAILIALSTGTACDLGEPIADWYSWASEHPHAYTLHRFEFDDLPDVDDARLYHDEATNEYVLFVFREKVHEVLAAGRFDPHGRCARIVTP